MGKNCASVKKVWDNPTILFQLPSENLVWLLKNVRENVFYMELVTCVTCLTRKQPYYAGQIMNQIYLIVW